MVLEFGDREQFGDLDRGFKVKGHMKSEEVVMSDKEGGIGHSAIPGIKTGSVANVSLVGSVEAFNDLFVGSKFF